jgi:Gamma-glutamyl cyclotransferase, AIG2-like
VTAEHVIVFFYGLFMDMGVLQQRGLAPRHPQVARLDGYDIDIRERATLIRNATARVYGIVTGLTHDEIGTLYADPSVRDYRPDAVVVTMADARQVPAWCYNLPQVTGSHRNTGYAVRLVEVAKTLAFPGDYLDRLQRLAQEEPAS